MEQTLEALASHVKGRVIGDGTIRIHKLNSLDAVQEGELAFVEDARRLPEALGAKVAGLIGTSSMT